LIGCGENVHCLTNLPYLCETQLTDNGGLCSLFNLVHADEVLHDLCEALLVLVHEVIWPAMGGKKVGGK